MTIPIPVMRKGYIQVYTGNGKGKTTAAIGLTIRALGAGLKVYIAQFMKNGASSEIAFIKRFSDQITIEHFLDPDHAIDIRRNAAIRWSERITEIFASRDYHIVVLEEANMAAVCRLLSVEELLRIIRLKPDPVELVITGRYADPRVIEMADLVTEMREVKHYFHSGVAARPGIEK